MRARYYDPQVGRFTSEDPKMDGLNWFSYCENNPINKLDADGKVTFFDFLAGSCEEVWDKVEEIIQANSQLNNIEQRMMKVLFEWGEQYASILGEDGFMVFGGEDLEVGVEGSYRIMWHFSEDAMFPHAESHIELAMKGCDKLRVFFSTY